MHNLTGLIGDCSNCALACRRDSRLALFLAQEQHRAGFAIGDVVQETGNDMIMPANRSEVFLLNKLDCFWNDARWCF